MRAAATCISIVLAGITGIVQAQQAANIIFSDVTTDQMTVTWTNGGGEGRILVAKEGSQVDADPTNKYNGNTSFGEGDKIGTGNYVIADLPNGSAPDNSTPIYSLKPGVTYYFKVFEYTTSTLLGIKTYSYNKQTATGNPANRPTLALEPLAHPESFAAATGGSDHIRLSFSAASTITNASGYIILRRQDSAYPTNEGITDAAAPAETPAAGTTRAAVIPDGSATSFNDFIVSPGTSYKYAIIPYGYNGNNELTYNYKTDGTLKTAMATTLAIEPGNPPADISFTSPTTTSVTVNFTAPADPGADGYMILRRSGSSPTAVPVDATSYTTGDALGDATIVYIGNSTTFTDNGLEKSTLYFYDIFAYNGQEATINYLASPLEGSRITLETEPVDAPSSLQFNAITTTTLDASFTASPGGAAGYLAIRKTDNAPPALPEDGKAYVPGQSFGDGTVAYAGALAEFSDAGLTPGLTYFYTLYPYNGSGDAINYFTGSPLTSSAVTLTTAPILKTAQNISNSGFTVSWDPVPNASNYSLDVSATNDFSGFVDPYNNLLVESGTSYAVSGLAPATKYYYRVRSNNSAGAASADSPVASTITVPADPTALNAADITTTSFAARWSPVDGADNYLLEVSRDNFQTFLTGYGPKTVSSGETTDQLSGLTAGTGYQYRVRAVNISGASGNSNVVSQPTIPLKPENLYAPDETTSSFLAVWSSSAGADFYEIDVSASDDFSTYVSGYQGKVISKTETVVTGLSTGEVFYFRVRAVNGGGKSENSDPQTVLLDGATNVALLDVSVSTFNNGQYDLGAASIHIQGNVASDARIKVKELTFFSKGITDKTFTSTMIPITGSSFQVTVQEDQLDDLGLEFYVKVTDAADRVDTTDIARIYKVFEKVDNSPVFIKNGRFSGVFNDYRIISIPYTLKSNNIETIFQILGAYDPRAWRLGHYQDGKVLETKKGILTIERGLGYWFNAKRADVLNLKTGAGEVPKNHSGEPFKMALSQGWNQIGNPYPFAIDWSDVLSANPGISGIGNLYQWENGGYKEQNLLPEYTGGFVYSEEAVASLVFPVTLRATSVGRSGSSGRSITSADLTRDAWQVGLKVISGEARHEVSGFGMHPEAQFSKDPFDAMALPRFLEYVDLNFEHAESGFGNFSRDIVPTDSEYKWSFAVETNSKEPESTLYWDHSDFGENDAQLYLLHLNTGTLVNMRAESAYTFITAQDRQHFNIYFTRENTEFSPEVMIMGKPYPNPSRETVSLNLVLPEADNDYQVEVIAYDHLGRPVKHIINAILPGGIHPIVWNTDHHGGQKVNPGFYLLRAVVNGKTIGRAERVLILK